MQMTRSRQTQVGAVFAVSAAVSALVVVWGVILPDNFGAVTTWLFKGVVSKFGWFFLLAANLFLVFVIYLAFSRHGKLKLGRNDDRPDFSRPSWFAMMFQAGMGPAIIFWGLAEPLSHYVNVPFDLARPGSAEAAQVGIQYSFFHWALHPWAIYSIAGLAVAYFSHRKGEPGLLSPVFRPLIGNRVDGNVGKAIDISAVLAVVFGIAVALGQAGLQLTAGLGQTFGLPTVVLVQLVVIGITMVAYMVSATTRIEHGIKWLANISMLIAPLLLVFYFVVGPTVTELNAFTGGLGRYLSNIVPMSFRLDAFSPDTEWMGSWTVFYWSWWIAWAPYVGLFMARISRGRSIREFIAATVLVPSLVSMAWIAVFGGAALQLARSAQGAGLAEFVQQNPAAGMFVFIQQFPAPMFMSILTLLVLWVFFVAGADAGTVVLGDLSTGGTRTPDTWVRLLWGVLLGGIAAILLASGGLDGLRQASVLAGTPFAIIMVAMCVAFYKTLSKENAAGASPERKDQEPSTQQPEPVAPGTRESSDTPG